MRKISRSALVPYTPAQMYALVDDVEAYPEFLPWCTSATVQKREDEVVEAELEMQRGGLRKSFVTRNRLHPDAKIDLELVQGPFRHLEGHWSFNPAGNAGCKVALDLSFEFESRVLDMLIGPFFEEICNRQVDAFTRRAKQVYGAGRDGG